MVWHRSMGYWPVLLYPLLFIRLTHRTDLTVMQAAALAGAASLILLYALQAWMSGRGFRALDIRCWPPALRRSFLKTTGMICLTAAICMLAAYFR